MKRSRSRVGAAGGVCVSLGTGTKCAFVENYENSEGTVVVDHHAEVIARRAFQLFLSKELKKSPDDVDGIFEEIMPLRFKIRDGITFHLYISRPPCGSDSPGKRHVKAIGHVSRPLHNCPLHEVQAMSCSDKISRWNVLGIQGALLSAFIEPVFLSTITIGGDSESKKFEVNCVINQAYRQGTVLADENIEKYGAYKPHHVPVVWVANNSGDPTALTPSPTPKAKRRNGSNKCVEGMNWFLGGGDTEIVNMQTGKRHEYSALSRLCKMRLLDCFWELRDAVLDGPYQRIMQRFKILHHWTTTRKDISYADLKKRVAPGYQDARSYYEEKRLIYCSKFRLHDLNSFIAGYINEVCERKRKRRRPLKCLSNK